MFLSDASLKRPVAMSTLILGLVVVGSFSYLKLDVDFLPKIDFPYVTVTTVYPGAGSREIETLVSHVIEEAVGQIDGIKHVRSTSMENISLVFVEFELGVDVDFAAMDVREKIDAVKRELPDDAEAPLVMKFDVNARSIMNLALTGDRPLNELYDLADDLLEDQMKKIPGVASVEIVGGKRREIQILVDQSQLTARDLRITDVIAALKISNMDVPAGRIAEKNYEHTIRLDGEFDDVEDIREIELQIPTPKGIRTIPLVDVARVEDGFEEQRQLAFYKGVECVGLVLKKRADANTVRVVERVRRELEVIRRMIPPDTRIEVVNDDSKFIQHSLRDVVENMIVGIILTALILYVFLHNFKSTVIAAVSMPISIVATFFFMHFAGFTLNVMSLMALAISIGILVTNSIVVLENIQRHASAGLSAREATRRGASEIAMAVLGSALTNVVVFLPIAFMSGLVGQFFKEFGLSVTFATLVSLFVSFTLTPILAARWFQGEAAAGPPRGAWGRMLAGWDRMFDRLGDVYGAFIRRALKHRWLVVAASSLLFAGGMHLSSYLGSEMVTEPDRAEIVISAEMPPGCTIERTRRAFEIIDGTVRGRFSDVVTGTYVKIGKVEGLFGKSSQGVHIGEMIVSLKDKADRREKVPEIMERMRSELKNVPTANIIVQQPSAIGGSEAPLQIEISGYDLEKLRVYSERIREHALRTPGTSDIDTTWRSGTPELAVLPRRRILQERGLSVEQLAVVLRANLHGVVADVYRVGSKEYDIRVRLQESDRTYVDQVGSFPVPLPGGGTSPVSGVAELSEREGPTQIIRKNNRRVVIISSNTVGRSLGEIWKDLAGFTDAMGLPPGYEVFYGGMVERMQESFADILMAFLMAVILTYLVLAALLESYVQPFTILLTLPLAMIGVYAALFVTNTTISLFSMMAVVMLVGIVVNNGILLIDYITELRHRGKSRSEALEEACATRLRPIVMTTVATILGMLPMVLGKGWGSEMRAPMGIVSIGGLVASSVLALVVIPVVYSMLDDMKDFLTRR